MISEIIYFQQQQKNYITIFGMPLIYRLYENIEMLS